jgi:hypothetical protein
MSKELFIAGHAIIGLVVGFTWAVQACETLPPKDNGSDDWAVGMATLIAAAIWPITALWLLMKFFGRQARIRSERRKYDSEKETVEDVT